MKNSLKTIAIRAAKDKGYYFDDFGVIYSPRGRVSLRAAGGYLRFNVRLDSYVGTRKISAVPVARFIAYCKYGEPALADGIQVRHKNGISIDNSPHNILIGTASENAYDKSSEARIAIAKHASSFNRKFTDEQEAEMRRDYSEVRSYQVIMDKFGVKKATLHYILNKQI